MPTSHKPTTCKSHELKHIKIEHLTLWIPVKVVLVMGGGLHMGDLLHEPKILMSKMVYSDVSLLETM